MKKKKLNSISSTAVLASTPKKIPAHAPAAKAAEVDKKKIKPLVASGELVSFGVACLYI